MVGAALLTTATSGAAWAEGDDATPPSPFALVADAGEFQTGYSVASPYNNIYVSWYAAHDDQSQVTYEVTVDGEVVRVVTDAYELAVITKRIEVPDGSHQVGVVAVDASGNRRDSTQSLEVVVDKLSPYFNSRPTLFLRTGRVTSEGYPMRATWSGGDEGTGLVAVHIGPNEGCCYTLDPDLTQFDFTVAPRSELNWRITLIDGVGRLTGRPRSGYVSPVAWAKTKHSDGWRQAQDPSASDGWEWVSTHRGDRFSMKVLGESVGWVTSTGPQRGRADVLVNGRVVDTVNLYSSERRPARVVWTSRLPKGDDAVTVTIVNRSPDSRRTIGVDALLLHR
ncbi:MAG TPA: hypothetical protein VFX15_04695 [Actinomycetes bacterium]|nr:hypothetical protein [Actinomycetes bacterium]